MDSPRFKKTFAVFARMWSANMIPIIEKSGAWPGFRYTEKETVEMEKQLDRFSRSMQRYRIFALVDAIITIALFVLFCLPMAWHLKTLQRAHVVPPGTLIYAEFGATTALGLALGVPLGLYLTCGLYRYFSWNADLTAADAELGQRLFARFCQQTTRVAALVCIGLLVLAIWPSKPRPIPAATSLTPAPKLSLGQRVASPLIAGSISFLTFWYYYGKNRAR